MENRTKEFVKELFKVVDFDKIVEVCNNLKKKFGKGHKIEYWYLYKPCYFYIQPITRDTKVMKGIIFERYTNEHNGDIYYRFFGEDGEFHNDDDDCMMSDSREQIETYLNELRDDLIAGGEFL